jgi:hypothetical protein
MKERGANGEKIKSLKGIYLGRRKRSTKVPDTQADLGMFLFERINERTVESYRILKINNSGLK